MSTDVRDDGNQLLFVLTVYQTPDKIGVFVKADCLPDLKPLVMECAVAAKTAIEGTLKKSLTSMAGTIRATATTSATIRGTVMKAKAKK